MRKALRIIAISAGILSVLSSIILGVIYMEDILGCIKTTQKRIKNKFNDGKLIRDIGDYR